MNNVNDFRNFVLEVAPNIDTAEAFADWLVFKKVRSVTQFTLKQTDLAKLKRLVEYVEAVNPDIQTKDVMTDFVEAWIDYQLELQLFTQGLYGTDFVLSESEVYSQYQSAYQNK